jgi:DNA gyrase subunit A
VSGWSGFGLEKHATFSGFIFEGFPFWNSVLKTARKIGKVTGINLVDETSELMVISQFGKIIRIGAKSIRAVGRSTQGVKLLGLEPQDNVGAVVISPEEAGTQPE